MTLNKTEYSGIPGNHGNITKTFSTSIDLEDMFPEIRVPDICVVSQSDFEQNCTFSDFSHITQVSMNGIGEVEIVSGTITCCTDSKEAPYIWIFNETNAFSVNVMGWPYRQEQSRS